MLLKNRIEYNISNSSMYMQIVFFNETSSQECFIEEKTKWKQ